MKRKNIILTVVIVLFIAVNIFLVTGDKTNRVDRVTFISDWTEATEKGMQDKLNTDGVLDYAEENFIYLDDSLGSFNEFLVEKGDNILPGDGLYSYDVHHYYELQLNLEGKKEELDEAVIAINQAISDINSKQITQEEFRFVYPDDTEAGVFKQNISNAQMLKEQYKIEKEKELAEKQAELKSIETQLADLRSGKDTIIVESSFEGKVTYIENSLNNPLITIEAPELYAVGELTEKERMKVDNAMQVEVVIRENDQLFDGNIVSMDEDPKRLSIEGNSIYPFHVSLMDPFEEEEEGIDDTNAGDDDIPLEDEEDIDEETNDADESLQQHELLKGYHADISIILDENPEAITAPQKLIKDDKIWLMTRDGELINKPVTTGILENGDAELTNEMILDGDWLALKPEQHFRDESQFITPLKPSHSNWKRIYKDGARKRSVLIGLLGR